VSLGRANLFFDQIEVVEQPFRGRRNPAVRLDRLRQQIAGSNQDAFILSQPAQKPVRSASHIQPVRARQNLAMLLHLVAAEEFRSQRWLVAGVLLAQAVSAETCPQMKQGPANDLAACLQV